MINRKSLAILFPLLLSSVSSISAKEIYNENGQTINLYGNVNPLYFYSYTSNPFSFHSIGNYTNLKIGIVSKSYINKFISGYMHVEYNPKFSSSYNENISNSFNKNNINLSYVGLDFGKWGSVDYGRNYGITYYSKQFTNKYFDNTESIIFHKDDNFLLGRADDVLTYKNKNFSGYLDGFDLVLQHHNYCRNDESNVKKIYNDSWGAALQYNSIYGFKIVGSTEISPYNEQNHLNKASDFVKSYALGCYYSFKNSMVSGFYCHSKNIERNFQKYDKKYKILDSIEVSGKYDFRNGFKASLGYIKSFGRSITNGNYHKTSKSDTLNNHLNFILTYNFNKNFVLNIHYKYSLFKNNKYFSEKKNYFDDVNNSIGTGIMYIF
ncbi:porin [Buchnera aphidicola]|uniref:porin n=1 Tax=Buchnera aphidicola TaxID=9 RepID=UPI0031B89532